jgi:hypothetical protein
MQDTSNIEQKVQVRAALSYICSAALYALEVGDIHLAHF